MANDKVVHLVARYQAEAVRYFFTLLIYFVLINAVSVDRLVVHVDLSAFFEHHWIFYFEREFVFYLDIADSEAVFHLEFRSSHHVFGSL
jgi:hypothetical protein